MRIVPGMLSLSAVWSGIRPAPVLQAATNASLPVNYTYVSGAWYMDTMPLDDLSSVDPDDSY